MTLHRRLMSRHCNYRHRRQLRCYTQHHHRRSRLHRRRYHRNQLCCCHQRQRLGCQPIGRSPPNCCRSSSSCRTYHRRHRRHRLSHQYQRYPARPGYLQLQDRRLAFHRYHRCGLKMPRLRHRHRPLARQPLRWSRQFQSRHHHRRRCPTYRASRCHPRQHPTHRKYHWRSTQRRPAAHRQH